MTQLDAHHQPATAYLAHQRRLDGAQVGHEALTQAGGASRQVLVCHHAQHGPAGGAGQRIASESRAVCLDRHGAQALPEDNRPHRHPAAQCFANTEQVGHQTDVIAGEPVPGAPNSRLNLVGDE